MGSRNQPRDERGRFVSASGGRSVGVATGVIRISTGQLSADARNANTAFKSIGDAGRQIGPNVKVGTDQAKKEIVSLQQTANNAFKQIAAGFALPGLIGATQSVKQIEFTIRQLAGSEQKANQQFEVMDRLAKRTGQSVLTIQKAAVGILPSINRANVDLEQTLLLAQRLAIFDPAQGAEGASFALREFMSGSITSLATRFELPRQELNRILRESQGNTQAMIDGLDALIAKMGITNDTIIAAGDQGINTFQKLKDEIILTSAQGFEPFLNNAIIPLVEGFNDLMGAARDANPELLEVAGTLAGILATVTALQAVGLGGKGLTGVAGLGAAGFVGVQAGTALARAGAEAGTLDNDRLKNVSQEEAQKVIGEYLKQATIIFADGLVDIAFKLVEGAITLENGRKAIQVAFEALKATFEAANTVVDISFDNIQTVLENAVDKMAAVIELAAIDIDNAFRTMLEAIGQLIVDLPTGLFDKEGEALIDAAKSGRTSDADRGAVAGRAGQDIFAGTASVDDALDELEARWEVFTNLLANMDIGLTDAQKANLELSKQQFKEDFIIPIAEGLGLLGDEAEKVKNKWAGGILARNPGSESGGPEFTDEMLEAFAKFQKDIAELNKKAADDRKKAEVDAAKQRSEATTKYNKELNEVVADSDKKRAEIQKDANTESIQAEQDHQDRLADIRRNAARDIERAAARFDQAGVFNAQQREKDAVDDEKRNHEKQRTRRQEAIAEELIDLETAKQERLNELRVGYQEELAAIIQQRNEKLAQINAQLRDELAARNQAYAETHNRLVAEAREAGNHNVRMLNIQQAGTAQLEAQYRDWITRMGGYRPPATPQQVQQATQSVQTAVKPIRIPGFASGIGNTGLGGVAMLHPGEMVGDATTAAMMRSMTGSQNPTQAQMQQVIAGGGGTTTINIQSVPIMGDMSGRSDSQFKAMAKEAFFEVMEALAS